MLGIVGPPAAGKSTLAKALVDRVNARLGGGIAAYAPMDGFHLSDPQLARLELLDRKGSPPTFDVHGYLALLRRLRADTRYPIYVPDYDRVVDAPIAARLVVMPDVRLIVTEGNYLASDEPVWRDVRMMMDGLWYLETPDDVREARLIERQLAGGRTMEQAVAWVANNDRPNGELVKESKGNCTRVIRAASSCESQRTRTSG